MKKRLSRLFAKWAYKLNPDIAYEHIPDVKKMGIAIHIGKKDIRDFRKDNPDIKSYRQGMESLIEQAKWRVAGAIGRGMMNNKAIHFEIRKTLYSADVCGVAFLYHEEETANE